MRGRADPPPRAVPDFGRRYRFLSELGRGGMGTVYRVLDAHRGEELALKLLHEAPASPEEMEAARREFALLSRIEHPGIARAFDFGYFEGRPYFTRQFISGESLGGKG
ncbi:MAG: protein kinase domain-containing protein, partial [Thermoanaerobaculia bacterium]